MRIKHALPHNTGHEKYDDAQPATGNGNRHYYPKARVEPFVARKHQINGKKHQYEQIAHGEQRVRMLEKKSQRVACGNELQGHARACQHQQFGLADTAFFHNRQHYQQEHIDEQKRA